MSQRVLIRHSGGTKSSRVEEFPVGFARELLFGRDAACDIRFDQDRDEFVSRRHMKLVVGDADRPEFTLVDLGALNGTFVNRRRVSGSARLQPGDIVQLGAGGPEFTFDVVPEDLRVTPLAALVAAEGLPEVRSPKLPLTDTPPKNEAHQADPAATADPVPQNPSSRGKAAQRQRHRKHPVPETRRGGLVFLALTLAALAGAGYFTWLRGAAVSGEIGNAVRVLVARWPKAILFPGAHAPEEVYTKNAEFLVTAESVWRLIDSASGRPLKQVYIRNLRELSGHRQEPLIPNAGRDLPVFVLLAGNRLLPLLTVAEEGSYQVIGGRMRSAGLLVSSDGFALISRRVTSPSHVPYDWPVADTAGVVTVFDSQLRLADTAVIARRQFPRWIPANTDFVLENALGHHSARVNREIQGKCLSDPLTVQLAGWRQRVTARVVQESDETGIAAIRLDANPGIGGATLETDSKAGDEVVMAAPADGRPATGRITSIDAGGRYDIAVGAAQNSLSGAPIFDRKGRAVAVQTENDSLQHGQVFGISIRRALESVGQGAMLRKSANSF